METPKDRFSYAVAHFTLYHWFWVQCKQDFDIIPIPIYDLKILNDNTVCLQ